MLAARRSSGGAIVSDQSYFEELPLPPYSQLAEEGALASALINPAAYRELAYLKPTDFFILRNQWVFEAMTRIDQRGDPIDFILVIEELREMGCLEEIGGSPYVAYLANAIGTSMLAEEYARVVEGSSFRRRMLGVTSDMQKIITQSDNAHSAYLEARKLLDATVPSAMKTSGLKPISEGYSSYFDRIEYLYENRNAIPGIPTGFTELDNLLGGLQDSELTILAGRPSMGKTSLQVNMLVNAAKAGKRGVFFSLEMAEVEIMNRIISAEIGVDGKLLKRGHLTENEWRSFVDLGETIKAWHLQIDDSPELTISHLRTKCLHLKSLGQLEFVYLDYLQKIGADNGRAERHDQVRQMVEGLKNLAKELQVPILAAAQLNRAVESRTDKRPNMADLAESGNIEKEADVILLLYRDEYYNAETERPNEADVIIAKNRNGATGSVPLYFRKELTQFANLKRTQHNIEDLYKKAAKKAPLQEI